MRYITVLLVCAFAALAQDGPVVSLADNPTKALFYDGSGNLEYICTASPASATSGSWTVSGSTLTSVVDSSNTSTVTTASAHGLLIGESVAISGTTFSKAAAMLTNIVVATNVGTATTAAAHGLLANDYVTVSGATVDTDLNGEYQIATVPTTKTFTFTTSSVANGTYVDATLQFETGDDDLLTTYTVATVPTTTTFTITTADVTDATYNEVGMSLATSSTVVLDTSARWAVQKLVYDSSSVLQRVLWADGNKARDNVCADRASLMYR